MNNVQCLTQGRANSFQWDTFSLGLNHDHPVSLASRPLRIVFISLRGNLQPARAAERTAPVTQQQWTASTRSVTSIHSLIISALNSENKPPTQKKRWGMCSAYKPTFMNKPDALQAHLHLKSFKGTFHFGGIFDIFSAHNCPIRQFWLIVELHSHLHVLKI